MGIEAVAVLCLVVAAIILFATERVPVDMVALLIMSSLVLSGILTPPEGLAGFSDPATVAVAGMLVLSSGLAATGAVSRIPQLLAPIMRHNFHLGLAAMMLTVSAVSGFINNTACVAVFIPVCIGLSRITRVSPSKLLMPLSFAAIFGGTCTLIGTSPNLVVNSIGVNHGMRPMGMFEFTPLGLLTLLAGTLYMVFVGTRLIPERRRAGELTRAFGMGEYLTEAVLLPNSPSVGQPLAQAPILHELDIDVVSIARDGEVLAVPAPDTVLHANDVLMVRCNVDSLRELQQGGQIRLKTDLKVHDFDLQRSQAALVEAVIPPTSVLVGESLKSYNFRNRFGATAIAIRHRGESEVLHEKLGAVRIEAGDVLLIEVAGHRLAQLKQNRAFVVVSESAVDRPDRSKMLTALAIFAGVVALSAFSLLAIEIGVVVGAVLMVLLRCMSLESAYRALDWKIIMLIAGCLSLGTAMEKTGLARALAHGIVSQLGPYGPVVLISGVYLATTCLTELISNSATAALMTPIALSSAAALGADPRGFLVAVTFACSASFMTPVGYQTNTMIYGPGQYRARDFVKVGTPLNVLFWVVASLAIPWLWPP